MRSFWRACRSIITRARFERDLREELRAHIAHRADDLAASGVPRDEAERCARVEFGALEACKERCRDESGFGAIRPLHGLGGDLTLAARRLAATPLFTTFAVLSLGVGLGVTTVAYSLVDAIFFKSSGVRDEDRVAFILTPVDGRLRKDFSQADLDDVRTAQRSFESLTGSANFFPAVGSPVTTDLMRGEAVDGFYFSTLGITLFIGRAIEPPDVVGGARVAVISHALWRLRFNSNLDVLGEPIRIDGRPFEIIGVAPKGFEGLAKRFDGTRVWIPISAGSRRPPASAQSQPREWMRLTVVGRLAPDATFESASAELTTIGAALDASYPRARGSYAGMKRSWMARRVADEREDDAIMRRFGLALIGLVGLVLVVACTNIANLVLARGTARHQEYAVRRAIGASRWRLIREQCAESSIIALAGAGVAWVLFKAIGAWLTFDLPVGSRMLISLAPALDPAVVTLAAAALLLSLVVFGLEPAIHLTRERVLQMELLNAGSTAGVPRTRRQRSLVRWQVAISSGFFILASLSVKYALDEARHDSGIDLDRVAVASVNFAAQQWDESRARHTLARIREEVARDPLVTSAAVATSLPFGTTATQTFILSRIDRPIRDGEQASTALGVAGTPQLFGTLGVRILHGRGFIDRDDAGASRVIVLSERTARKLFGTADAVGREVFLKDREPSQQGRSVARKLALPAPTPSVTDPSVRTVMVVGVASNTDVGQLFDDSGDLLYLPFSQQWGGVPFGIVAARSDDPSQATAALRDAIRRAAPDLAIDVAGTGLAALGGPTVYLRAISALAVSLGALTLLLAMVGLYGVQSHGVSLRTREIGVRLSMGATDAQIRSMVLKDGYQPVVQGIALGLVIGFIARALVRAFVWEKLELVDALMVFAVPAPFILAAFFACWLPARRAARVDPNVALRHL